MNFVTVLSAHPMGDYQWCEPFTGTTSIHTFIKSSSHFLLLWKLSSSTRF